MVSIGGIYKNVVLERGSYTRHTPHHARVPRARARAGGARARRLRPPRLRERDRLIQNKPAAQAAGALRARRKLRRLAEKQSETHHQAEADRHRSRR